MDRESFVSLSRDDLIDLILAQAQQISALTARIAALEAKLAAPGKNPDNSSLPPSKGHKPNLPAPTSKKPRPGRPGLARALAEHPDATIEATLAACPHCAHALGAGDQPDIHAYDHIDLPPIRPTITRINRHRGICPCCRRRFAAPAPAGCDPGSPFGPGLCALIIHLHITQAISFERLARVMAELFGVVISEGAIANILARSQSYGGQLHHGAVRQVCLAHLLRDTKFAIEEGCTVFAPGFRLLLLLRAVAIGKRHTKTRIHP